MGHTTWPSTRSLLISTVRSRTEEKKGGEKGERGRAGRGRVRGGGKEDLGLHLKARGRAGGHGRACEQGMGGHGGPLRRQSRGWARPEQSRAGAARCGHAGPTFQEIPRKFGPSHSNKISSRRFNLQLLLRDHGHSHHGLGDTQL